MKSSSAFLAKVEPINAELLTLTYGSLIVRLIKDYEKPEEINEQLEKMGYNIGIRLIDDWLAKSCLPPPDTFERAVEIIATQAFPFYLGINKSTFTKVANQDSNLSGENQPEYSITFKDNPLNDFVELPEEYRGLWYSNIICGVIRGALEAINVKVECKFVQDNLRGNDVNEIRIKLIEIIEEKLQEEEQ